MTEGTNTHAAMRTRQDRSRLDFPMQPILPGERKQQWIYRLFTSAIAQGLIEPGDPVPSTRTLANRWSVSRGVVELTYEQLRDEGYLCTQMGSGTWVSEALPDSFLRVSAPGPSEVEGMQPAAAQLDGLSNSPTGIGSGNPADSETLELPLRGNKEARAGVPFIARLPDVQVLDMPGWRKSVLRAVNTIRPEVLMDADPRGLFELREEICKHVAVSRGFRCAPEDVILVTGIRHAIDLVTRVASGPGGRIVVEDPCYAGAALIFERLGCHVVPVPVDADGINVSQLPDAGAAMVYVTPAHQSPTGVVLSHERRLQLLAWARKHNALILEDDYDSDFSYETSPSAALKSLDSNGHVVFVGSFNKCLFSGLRIGYMVVPPRWREALIRLRANTGRSNAVLDQWVLLEFMRSKRFERHLKRSRVTYQFRRDAVLHALRQAGWQDHQFQGVHAGFHFVLQLPPGVDAGTICARAAEAGIALQSCAQFQYKPCSLQRQWLIIGYAALTSVQVRWWAKQLTKVLRVGE